MSTRPKVSILIPVYNTAKYLPKCLESAMNQTLQEIEIIAVNDASPDNAAEVLAEYAAKDPRIKVVTHEKNGGILAARLSGIRAATGMFITCLDADDTLTPDIARAAYETAIAKDADMVHFQFDIRMENGKKTRFAKSTERNINPAKKSLVGKEVFEGAFVNQLYRWNIVGKLVSYDVFRKAAEALPPGYYIMAEDFCFCTLMSFYAKRYEPLQKKGYNYILNTGVSAYRPADRKGFERLCTVFTALNAVQSFLKENDAFEEYETAFRKQEERLLGDLMDRWIHRVLPSDRPYCFDFMLKHYDPVAIVRSMKKSFCATGDMEEAVKSIGSTQFPTPTGPVKKLAVVAKNALQLTAFSEQNELAEPMENTGAALASDADTVVLYDAGEQDIAWDILALKVSGKRVIMIPSDGLLDGNIRRIGSFAGRALAYRFADAVGCYSEREASFHRKIGIRATVLPILKTIRVRKESNAKNIVWLGNGGDAERLLMAAGAFSKLRDAGICSGELVICTPLMPEESERKFNEWAVSLNIKDAFRICRKPDTYELTAELSQAVVLMTEGETEIAAPGHFFEYGPVIAADPSEISVDELVEKLKTCFESKYCPPVPEIKRDNWDVLLNSLTEPSPAKTELTEELLSMLVDGSLHYERFTIVPPRDGDTFHSFYSFFDKILANFFPAGTKKRHILFAGTRYVMRKIFRKD